MFKTLKNNTKGKLKMKLIKKPDTAIFFGTYKEMIYNSTPEQRKAIMTAFCQYAFDNINPTVSSDISLVWGVMKGNIDNDYRKFNERCEKNRENALKRYGKSADNDLETVTYTINGHEFELKFPPENKANIINEKAFKELFSETEDEPQKRIRYISDFVNTGNKEKWELPYEDYENETWDKIYNGDL